MLPPRRARLLCVAVCASFAVTGCSTGDPADDADGSSPATSVASTTAVVSPASTTDPSNTGPVNTSEPGRADPEPGVIEVIQPGVEPRSVLAVEGTDTLTLDIDAAESATHEVAGDEFTETSAATYRLDITTSLDSESPTLSIVPTITSLDVDPMPTDVLGEWQWILDRHGRVVNISNGAPDARVSPQTAELLALPDLVLATPTDPVGAGAVWRRFVGPGGATEVTVTLVDVTPTELVVEVTSIGTSDQGDISITTAGTYDRSSHVATDLTTELVVTVTADVVADGEPAILTGEQRSTRSIVEVER